MATYDPKLFEEAMKEEAPIEKPYGLPPLNSSMPARDFMCISCGFLNHDVAVSKTTFICRNCGLEQEK